MYQVLTDTIGYYIDSLSTLVDTPHDEEEFENEDDKYIEGNEREKRRLDKNAKVSRRYEVIGTVLDRKVIFSSSIKFDYRDFSILQN